MRRAAIGRLVAAASLVALLGSACTPGPDPQPTPTPTTSATPPETTQEREQRIAYVAAEKAYREFRLEYRQALDRGGLAIPSQAMTANAGGPYLEAAAEVLEAYRGLGQRSTGLGRIIYVQRGGYSSTSLILEVCEDTRSVTVFDRNNKVIGRGEIRKASLDVRLVGARWKVWSGTGEKVSAC